ncbi:MAG: carboxylating nicotinate-nucleotide diphosphorylase [Patulibacter sp.]|nr:carboxylating nicotinate-nucleotide diphosphorylase [Patulibacter sp.]
MADTGVHDGLLQQELNREVAIALAEDIGDRDVTAEATVPAGSTATARVVQKAPGVLSGLDCAVATLRACDPDVKIELLAGPGVWREGGPVLEARGDARALLAAERTALNFLQQLGGVATLTARCVAEVEGTGAQIIDTRKTVPGMRHLQKRAVLDGGGANHRIGLFDMVLIKENHAAVAGGITKAIKAARETAPDLPLECEVRDLAELDEALAAGAPRVLLDNMDLGTLREAVERCQGKAITEASGGLEIGKLRAVAETGVDLLSLGSLTHSAPALDLSMLIDVD